MREAIIFYRKVTKISASCSVNRIQVDKILLHEIRPNKMPGDTRTIYNGVRGAFDLSFGQTKGINY